jgi:hypothetical protein
LAGFFSVGNHPKFPQKSTKKLSDKKKMLFTPPYHYTTTPMNPAELSGVSWYAKQKNSQLGGFQPFP